MARTINGNLTGKAASTARRELNEQIEEMNIPNSDYWKTRLDNAMEVITSRPELEEVWDSDLVPDHTDYMTHALLAEKIVSGELQPICNTLPGRPVMSTMEPRVHKTWRSAMEQRDRDFNRRYFNNPDGNPEFK
jgi:hypothetical protein